jgi:translocation and assembly module TamB
VRLEFIRSLLAQRQLLPQMSGIADLTAQASGSITDVSSYRINFDGSARDVVINGRPAGNAQLTGRTVGQQLNVNLTSTMLGSPQVITASVNFGSPDMPATIETRLNGADLTALFATLLPASNVTVSGRATGTLRATGNLMGSEGFGIGGMRGTAHFEDLTLQIEDIQLSAERPLLVQFSPNEVFFEKTRFTGPGTNISFGGTAALSEAGKQNLRVDGELNLRVLNGLSPNIFVSGAAQVAVRVNGTYADPRITGSASVGSGSLSTIVADERISVTNIKTRLIFTSRQAQIDHFTASLGGGKLSILGGALLEGLTPSQYRLTVRGDDLSLPFPRDFRSLADANLVVSGTGQGMLISGLLNLNRAEYTEDIDLADFINRRRQGTITETTEGGMLGSTQLDVRVEGRDALVIRNNLAETVGSVSLHITGASEDPVIAGRISTDGGTVNFRNERYEIVRAFVDLPARRNADPYINLQAEADIKGYRVIATIVGPLSQPTASLRSDPALPQADVVALVTTGDLARTDESASVLSQSSVGTAASLLTETLINRPARRATEKLFGLTTFEIDPQLSNTTGAGPSARLTVGRQINRNLTVTYSTNLTSEQAQVLALEYRLSNRLSFVAQYDQGSQNNLRTGNNNFSFEIRFRKRF